MTVSLIPPCPMSPGSVWALSRWSQPPTLHPLPCSHPLACSWPFAFAVPTPAICSLCYLLFVDLVCSTLPLLGCLPFLPRFPQVLATWALSPLSHSLFSALCDSIPLSLSSPLLESLLQADALLQALLWEGACCLLSVTQAPWNVGAGLPMLRDFPGRAGGGRGLRPYKLTALFLAWLLSKQHSAKNSPCLGWAPCPLIRVSSGKGCVAQPLTIMSLGQPDRNRAALACPGTCLTLVPGPTPFSSASIAPLLSVFSSPQQPSLPKLL